MSSESKARLAGRAPVQDMTPARSTSAEREAVHLRLTGPLEQPVSVFRRLFNEDATARAAKDAIDELAVDGEATCQIPSDTDMVALAHDLAAMNVMMLRRRHVPDAAAFITDIRSRHGLSQKEFADRLGLDVRSLQSWEQGRHRPEHAALTLIRAYDQNPAAVMAAVFSPVDCVAAERAELVAK